MKKFEVPEIQVELFAVEEVLTGSGWSESNESDNDNQLPFG